MSSGFSLFGNVANNNSSSTSGTGASTPAQTGGTGLFGGKLNAAPKPPGGSLFGNPTGGSSTPAPTGGLFGTSSTTGSSGLFGGNPTTSTNPASTTTTASAPTGSLFGGNTAATSTSTAGTNPQPASNSLFGGGGSLFGNKPAEQSSSSTSTPKPAAASSFFGQPPAGSSSTSGTTSLFGTKPAEPAKPSEAAASANTTAPPAGNSLFSGGLFGNKPAASTAAGTATPTPPSGGLFGSTLGQKPAEKSDTTTATPGATTAAPTASGTGLNLFGTKPAEKKDDAASTAVKPTEGGLGALGSTALTKPAATATPTIAVAPPSMLKGKTIEEIVNGWSSDLETHVRDFNKLAAEVAVWDRTLIENSNNLSAIYSHVLAAEREQTEIEQSLDHVEQQQKELVATLDAYEKVTQEILGSQGGSLRALDSGPADTERDKNYMLATDLHSHLDDLSGSLTQMIEAVNSLSLPSSGSTSSDDPMSQISQILSSHLESLQWIDGAVREVESKVSDVEKRVKESGHGGSLNASRSRSFGLNR